MKYEFQYETKAVDLFKLSMYSIYSSMAGVVNIIFTAAMVILIIRFFSGAALPIKIVLIAALSIFIVIQPLVVYYRAKRQLKGFPKDMAIGFDDKGLHVKSSNQVSDIKWRDIKGLVKKPGMLVLLAAGRQGFILTDKTLGNEKAALLLYIESKLSKKS